MTAILTEDLYKATVSTTGGRAGRAVSDDGILDLPLARPGNGRATNPEQLLAAGWAACFQSALQHVAKGRRMAIADSVVTAQVILGKEADGGFALRAVLEVAIPGLQPEQVQDLAEETHRLCPYSKATHGNIAVELRAA